MKAISLFSGIGGMDFGFTDAGFDIAIANEIDNKTAENYLLNRPNAQLLCGSISSQSVLKKICASKQVEIVFGGPPCQGFSVAGKMDPNDERSQLIFDFMKVVENVRPKAFVMENVNALATSHRWEKTRAQLISIAKRLNFTATIITLNAAHFGVPQNRTRMFLVGISNRLSSNRKPTEFYNAFKSTAEQFKEVPHSLNEVFLRLGRAGEPGNARVCNAKITYAKNPVLRKSAYSGMLFNGSGRPLDPAGYSCTLPASMGGNRTPIIDEEQLYKTKEGFIFKYHQHLVSGGEPYIGEAPKHIRRLTIDECLAIQTFPSNLILEGRRSILYKQIGNAVPRKLAAAVAKTVKRFLE